MAQILVCYSFNEGLYQFTLNTGIARTKKFKKHKELHLCNTKKVFKKLEALLMIYENIFNLV
ncbi:MAG: hypothetical protein PWR03_734 [Tenuifilum sp.]|jgi:hypothetical protein|nr:hypothetical protein [Tenuifilum sp.]